MSGSATRTFTGVDRLAALFNAIGCAVVFGFIVLVAPEPWRPVALRVGIAVTVAMSAARYRLRVGPDGIVLEELVAWVIPTKRRRYALDAEFKLYESWDAETPEGICVTPLLRPGEPTESDCFGPTGDVEAIQRFLAETSAALQAARASLPPTPRELRCPLLAHVHDKLELHTAERNGIGRVRRIRSSAAFPFAGIEVPKGSIFELNHEPYLVPTRDDRVDAVQLAEAVQLPQGLTAPVESRLSVDEEGRITALKGPLGPEVEIDGRFIAGNEVIAFDKQGRVRGFTLARAAQFGPVEVPAASTFHEWPAIKGLERRWSCHLGGAATVGGIELRAGDRIAFNPEGTAVLAIDPQRDLTVDGVVLIHGRGAFPTHPDGRVNLRAAKKLGLTAKSD